MNQIIINNEEMPMGLKLRGIKQFLKKVEQKKSTKKMVKN